MEIDLALKGIHKSYGNVVAVDGVSFDIPSGQFVSLLGPSGCGKTTTLRAIAGLESVDRGSIFLRGRDITSEPPYLRGTGMVFQSYALFPHMTVFDNVAFGLRMAKVDKRKQKERVESALGLVRLETYSARYPRELSGGQQQRVALARALAIEPSLLLLDEPLSNLDAKLRDEMRIEIKQIQSQVGVTSVFVTHDQEEALTMSDSIVVMESGKVVERGTPEEIYQNPVSEFTARFVGSANLFPGTVKQRTDAALIIQTDSGLTITARDTGRFDVGAAVSAVVKSERVKIHPKGGATTNAHESIAGTLRLISFLGPSIQYNCVVAGQEVIAKRPNDPTDRHPGLGDEIELHWEVDDVVLVAR